MFIIKLAAKNVFRNTKRSVLTGLSIMFSVAMLIVAWSFIEGSINDMMIAFIRFQSGHVRVMTEEFAKQERLSPLQYSIADYLTVKNKIAAVPGVKTVAGRLKFGVLLDYAGSTKQTLGIGIEPAAEESILELSKKIVQGRAIRSGSDEVNIGVNMARDLKLKEGDTLTVVTQTAYGSMSAKNFKVVGIYDFDSPTIDRKVFLIPIESAQYLLDLEGSASEIFIMTNKAEAARRVARQISTVLGPGYRATAWQEQGAIYFFLEVARYIYLIILIIIVLLSAFTILNTMFMSVLERTREIGMMKALGMTNRQLVIMVLFEALVLGALASLIGAVVGAGASYYLSTHGLDFTKTVENMDFPTFNVYYSDFSWRYIWVSSLIGMICSMLAAVFPAMRAAKMEPTEALHEI
ncbi:MAG: FtsX-like permease family protein [Candidatus Margulisbacteria bacterium]|nr:FtsX-like permease family protein [Candidatus Margulisiibacteriota bacterium]